MWAWAGALGTTPMSEVHYWVKKLWKKPWISSSMCYETESLSKCNLLLALHALLFRGPHFTLPHSTLRHEQVTWALSLTYILNPSSILTPSPPPCFLWYWTWPFFFLITLFQTGSSISRQILYQLNCIYPTIKHSPLAFFFLTSLLTTTILYLTFLFPENPGVI